ncbi:filamentous hemagglutinin family N-terminal domain-containing protein, partial [Selenomonas ruminantium]
MMKKSRYDALRLAVAIGLSASLWSGGTVEAFPQQPQIRSGNADINKDGDTLRVKQDSQRLALDWDSFNIAKDEHVIFEQGGRDKIALNRIVGDNTRASEIYGSLQADGTVFLLNPHGVIFQQGAQIDVGNLVASTATVDDTYMQNFSAKTGDILLQLDDQKPNGIKNCGEIKSQGGLVVLHASKVENTGAIENAQGTVALAAAKKLNLSLDTAGKINFTVNDEVAKANALNSGTIKADGGYILMTAKSTGNMLQDTVVNNTGIMEARTLNVNDKGEILLDGGNSGIVDVGGTMDVSGTDAGQSGGTIQIKGDDKRIHEAGLKMLADGDVNGGQIRLSGGEKLGFVGRSQGLIRASGGEKAGEFLIDSPVSVSIGTQVENGNETLKDETINNNIKPGFINRLLSNGTNVTIQADNGDIDKLRKTSIYVNAPITKTAVNSDTTLNLRAQRDVYVNGSITSNAGKLNINLQADTDGVGKGMVVLNGNVATNGGDFTSGTGQNITDGTVGTFIGNVKDKIRDKQDIIISTKGGNVNFYGDVGLGIENGTFTIDTTGGTGTGNINISGNLGSVNTYKFFQNGSSSGKGGDAVVDGDLEKLLEVYYDKYLKDVVWLKTSELSTKTITTPEGKTQTVYDWLKERILGDESQYLKEKPANAAAEKKAIEDYYKAHVQLGSRDTPMEFSELAYNKTLYQKLASHILTTVPCTNDNRESILNRWERAKVAAQEGTEGGAAQGDKYLATITTPLEDWVIRSQLEPLLTKDVKNEEWLLGGRTGYTGSAGAKYKGSAAKKDDRVFSWQTGPEAGQAFYKTSGIGTGTTTTNMYQGWSKDTDKTKDRFKYEEPNNNENPDEYEQPFVAIGFRKDTSWADVNDQKSNVRGFVQETNRAHADVELKSSEGNITIGGNVGKSAPLHDLTINTAGKVKTGGDINPGTMDKYKEHQYQIDTGEAYTGLVQIDGQLNIVGSAGVEIGDHITADSVDIGSKGNIGIHGIDAVGKVKLVTEGLDSTITMNETLPKDDGSTLNDGIKTQSTDPDAVILDAHDGKFVNKSTVTKGIETGQGGGWKIYTKSPEGNEYGKNLDSGTYALWGRSPKDTGEEENIYRYAALPEDENHNGRYIFNYQPVMTYTVDDMEKTYGESLGDKVSTEVSAKIQDDEKEKLMNYRGTAFDESSVLNEETKAFVDVSSKGFAAEATRTDGDYEAEDGDKAIYAITVDEPSFNSTAAAHGYKPELAGESKLTINRRDLQVSVNPRVEYGSNVSGESSNSEEIQATGLVNDDTIDKVGYVLTDGYRSQLRKGAVTADVGAHTGAVKTETVSFTDTKDAANYQIVAKEGTLTITPHDVVLKLTGEGEKLTEDNIINTATPYEEQLINGDTSKDAPKLDWKIGDKLSDSKYAIGVQANQKDIASGDVVGNYRFTYEGAYILKTPVMPDKPKEEPAVVPDKPKEEPAVVPDKP